MNGCPSALHRPGERVGGARLPVVAQALGERRLQRVVGGGAGERRHRDDAELRIRQQRAVRVRIVDADAARTSMKLRFTFS